MYDPLTDYFIAEGNGDKKLSMASTTKIMTSLICAEYIEKYGNKEIEVTSEMVKVEGSALGLKEGDKITLEMLIIGMLLASGNDAANTAAFAVAGNLDAFSKLMNKKAKELSLENTSFVTPSGLDSEGHFSTAKDMAKLASVAMENKFFRSVVSSEKMSVSYYSAERKSDITAYLKNHNKLLSLLEGCIGVKTGFTKKSGRCLVSAIEKDGSFLVAVTLNAPDDWNDHIALYSIAFEKRKSYGIKNKSFSIVTADGEKIYLKLENTKVIYYFSNGKIEEKIYLPRFVYKDNLRNSGRVDYILNGKVIESRNIGI